MLGRQQHELLRQVRTAGRRHARCSLRRRWRDVHVRDRDPVTGRKHGSPVRVGRRSDAGVDQRALKRSGEIEGLTGRYSGLHLLNGIRRREHCREIRRAAASILCFAPSSIDASMDGSATPPDLTTSPAFCIIVGALRVS